MEWELSPEEAQFVEEMGLFYQQYGIARIGGRMLGLLMIAPEPLSLDDMARLLQVSRASISTNARNASFSPLLRRTSRAGDRRDYYEFAQDAWEHYLSAATASVHQLERIATFGIAAVTPSNTLGKARLEEMAQLCDFYLAEINAMIERWRTRRRGATDVSDPHERRRS